MDENIETAESSSRPPVSRRTVVKGIAWGVPAITILGATPAFADSKVITASLSGTRSGRSVAFTLTFSSNVTLAAVGVGVGTITGFTVSGPTVSPTTGTGPFTAAFTAGNNTNGSWNYFPAFQITISYTGVSKTLAVAAYPNLSNGTSTFTLS